MLKPISSGIFVKLHIYLTHKKKQKLNSIQQFFYPTPDCEFFELVRSKGYNEKLFRADLKQLFRQIGIENKKTVFYLNADQVRLRFG